MIACGTNHEGLGPAAGRREVVDFEIQGIGRMRLDVRDPLKRSWEKGIYMGSDSTNPEAVKRNASTGRSPLAIAIIVSFEMSSSSELTTQ